MHERLSAISLYPGFAQFCVCNRALQQLYK